MPAICSTGRRWLLFGGKGGVGKSTCAAAVGARPRRGTGRACCCCPPIPAHSLGDVFGAALRRRAAAGAGRSGEPARARNRRRRRDGALPRKVRRRGRRGVRAHRAAGGRRPGGVPRADRPGAAGHRRSDRRRRRRRRARPTARARYDVDRHRHGADRARAAAAADAGGAARVDAGADGASCSKYREIVGAGTLASLLVQLSKRLRGLQDILADAAQRAFVVVTRAAALPTDESRDLIDALRARSASPSGHHRQRRRALARAAGAARSRARRRARSPCPGCRRRREGYAIIEAPAEMPPPHGAAALRAGGPPGGQIT